MTNAVCTRCGARKRHWSKECPSCGLDPRGDVDMMARSYILSTERRDLGDEVPEEEDLPEFSGAALDAIGSQIRSGKPFVFDPAWIRRVGRVLDAVDAMTWRDDLRMFLGGVLWILPLWIIIALGVLLFILKHW